MTQWTAASQAPLSPLSPGVFPNSCQLNQWCYWTMCPGWASPKVVCPTRLFSHQGCAAIRNYGCSFMVCEGVDMGSSETRSSDGSLSPSIAQRRWVTGLQGREETCPKRDTGRKAETNAYKRSAPGRPWPVGAHPVHVGPSLPGGDYHPALWMRCREVTGLVQDETVSK